MLVIDVASDRAIRDHRHATIADLDRGTVNAGEPLTRAVGGPCKGAADAGGVDLDRNDHGRKLERMTLGVRLDSDRGHVDRLGRGNGRNGEDGSDNHGLDHFDWPLFGVSIS